MTFRVSRSAISLIAFCASSVAFAGEEPLYEAEPAWVEPVDLDDVERDPANDRIVSDTQIMIEDGLHWEYNDDVFRINTLADLSNVGTLTAKWMPDKGDLIVHELSILRNGEAIDLIEQGETLEVLRRERRLEQRILDGSLTATLAVPGLEVGDELRMRYSVTTSDQALGKEVQSQNFLWREPSTYADFSRIRASWPDDLDVQYKAGPNYEAPPITQQGGFNSLEVILPLEEAEDLPSDVPLRYRRGTILQIGTFADWAEVSSTMAPYYKTDGALDGIPDLLAKVEAIRTDYPTELGRAVAALELVQEDVRYLLNGLDGGNYLPQDVATTWEKKYGDCKAKTVILLAILNHLGIESEAVLASISAGNAVPISLPVPGAFDHVLVRATIDGKEYYMDGTSLGANIKTVGNVPPFEYALPIRDNGADLEPIVQTLPRFPDLAMTNTIDASAGADLPILVTITMNSVGASAAQINSQSDKMTDERKKALGRSFGQGMDLLDVEIIEGSDDSEATMIITGIMAAMFEFDGLRAETDPTSLSGSISFSPDRSRREWRDIPVSNRSPSGMEITLETILPQTQGNYELKGGEPIDVEVAGQFYTRVSDLSPDKLVVTESLMSLGGEIQPENFREERRKAAALARQETMLIAPDGLPRIWRFAQADDRSSLEPLEKAYAQLIENEPDEMDPYLSRAAFRYDTYDFAGALEDMDKVVELEATAEYYSQRATVHGKLLDKSAAKEDLEEAYLLDPTPWRAMALAEAMANLGDIAGARENLEYEDGDEDVRQELAVALATLDAMEGKGEEGLARIDEMLLDSPNDSGLMNEKCWYMATWQINVADGLAVCTKAVENSGEAANILDSRAMMFLRNGMLAEAYQDAEAALALQPGQTATVMLRGLIRLEQGDEDGQADIDEAIARDPELKETYGRWGFDV
uniref:DUF3857 domain-containing protein n=1 Tax=uncultured Erythrobacter sp. TaxID=263913 RepID=UPI0026377143|nr:DUF3857 domain-containing protein [uncultured Erythrobacter sp.]